jgi:hypothetical protein
MLPVLLTSGGEGGHLVRNVLLVLVSLGLAVIMAEAGLRVTGTVPAGGVWTVDADEFERVPGLFSPGIDVVDARIPQLRYHVVIDSLGYRGASFPRQKPRGETRLLYVGDSNAFGDFVDNHEALPPQLEQRLAAECRGVRVINAGVGGTTIVTHSNMVDRALGLGIDGVILQFSENDVSDLAVMPMWDQLALNRERKSSFPMNVAYPVLRNTSLWNLALQTRGLLRAQSAHGTAGDAHGADPSVARLRNEYVGGMEALAASLEERGVPLQVVIFPSHLSLYGLWESDQLEWFRGVTARLGIPTIDLTTALRSSELPDTVLFLLPHDGHPSARGYAVAADEIASHLVDWAPLASGCAREPAVRVSARPAGD